MNTSPAAPRRTQSEERSAEHDLGGRRKPETRREVERAPDVVEVVEVEAYDMPCTD